MRTEFCQLCFDLFLYQNNLIFFLFFSLIEKVDAYAYLENYLQLLIRYCSPDVVTEINLRYKHNVVYYENLNERARPFLRKFKQLDVRNGHIFYVFMQLMPSLQSLTLRDSDPLHWCTHIRSLENIRELRLKRVLESSFSAEKLRSGLNIFPNLEIFECSVNQRNVIKDMGEILVEKCPNLRVLAISIVVISPDDGLIGQYTIDHRFEFLQQLRNLEEVKIGGNFWNLKNIYKLVQFTPNIRKLDIKDSPFIFFQPHHLARSIKEVIANRRDHFPANDCVHLIVNRTLHSYFKVVKDIDEIIRFTIGEGWFEK